MISLPRRFPDLLALSALLLQLSSPHLDAICVSLIKVTFPSFFPGPFSRLPLSLYASSVSLAENPIVISRNSPFSDPDLALFRPRRPPRGFYLHEKRSGGKSRRLQSWHQETTTVSGFTATFIAPSFHLFDVIKREEKRKEGGIWNVCAYNLSGLP